MFFKALLKRLDSCLIPKTSFSEAGGRVSVQPKSEETIHFFVIDDDINPDCTLRQDLGIVGAICDLLVSYAKENKKLLCLVELKGKNLRRAVEQVANTYKYLRKSLSQPQLQQIKWKAYIHQHGSSPSKTDRDWIKNRLERGFGKNNYCVSRASDLGNFLRQ